MSVIKESPLYPVLPLRGGGADQIKDSIERTNQEIIEWIFPLSTEKISIQKRQIEASKYFVIQIKYDVFNGLVVAMFFFLFLFYKMISDPQSISVGQGSVLVVAQATPSKLLCALVV